MNESLPPYYYLDNFRFMLDWVASQYGDLLGDDELAFVQTFNQLQRNSQCLLVRMISRKGPWFRSGKLKYSEIEDQQGAANQLLECSLVTNNAPLSLIELADLLTKPELLWLFSDHLGPCKSQRKEHLVDLLKPLHPRSLSWSAWTGNQLDQLYRLDVQPISNTLMLLFFGNPYQDLTEFVLQDLGLFRYEHYSIDKQHRVFNNREELLQYQHLLLVRDKLAEATDLESLQQLLTMLPEKFSDAAMERRRARLYNQLAYEFERNNQLDIALQLYQQVDLPPSRERQIRLLEKLDYIDQAWELLTRIIANPTNEHELQLAERMAPRLAKKARIEFNKRPTSNILACTLILPMLTDDHGNRLRVEEVARRHLDSPEAPCLYVENLLVNGLFGLWLWPELFRSSKGAFANPFQSAPLDLYQEDFQQRRPDMHKLWQLLDNQQHRAHIKNMWQQKFGIANPFIHWQFLDEALLELALNCIPAHHLKGIFQRLLFDLKANRSGLPDLIQFFPGQNRYRMIEIKGPGDRIQDNQLRWLDYFNAQKIPAEVCYVCWQ